MDESRKAFESWLMEELGYQQDYLEYWRGEGDYKEHRNFSLSWKGWNKAWQASRAAIEIKLDDKVMVEDEFDKGHNCAIDYCAEAIRAAGIKVKE